MNASIALVVLLAAPAAGDPAAQLARHRGHERRQAIEHGVALDADPALSRR